MTKYEPHPYEDIGTALDFALDTTDDGLAFLRCWNVGDWSTIDRDWPEWEAFVARRAGYLDPSKGTFQERVAPWMLACFGREISNDKLERADRHLEEVLEMLQAVGYPSERVVALRDYVYSREVGELPQEVGGVNVTLAAFCLAHGIDMHECAEEELKRIWTKVDQIRKKQAGKPKGSALPIAVREGNTQKD